MARARQKYNWSICKSQLLHLSENISGRNIETDSTNNFANIFHGIIFHGNILFAITLLS